MTLWLALTLTAAPADARFLLTIADSATAELHVRLTGRELRYDARWFLEDGQHAFSRRYELDAQGLVDGHRPEVLALLSPPRQGCQSVFEERMGRPEQLCVEARDGAVVHGRLDEVEFSATYEKGTLARIDLPGAHWERVESSKRPPRGTSPFREGFAVEGSGRDLVLEPALPEVRVVPVSPSGAGAARVARTRCLTLAREAVANDPELSVVLGLFVDGGRAFPHAWVRRGDKHFDPSRLPGDVGTYLELPAGIAGRVYLELSDGTRQLSLRP